MQCSAVALFVCLVASFVNGLEDEHRRPTGCATARGKPCIFPCRYDGVVYHACTNVDWDHSWCCTSTDEEGGYVVDEWDNCNDDCEEQNPQASPDEGLNYIGEWGRCSEGCQLPTPEPALEPTATVTATNSSVCATTAGVPCVFPCRRSGVLYTTCTTADWDRPWCCTETDRYGNLIISSSEWGDCNDNCETEPERIARNANVNSSNATQCNASCDGYELCFSDEACAYVAYVPHKRWGGPYAFCNALDSPGGCEECFPDWPCRAGAERNVYPAEALALETGDSCAGYRHCLQAMGCTEYSAAAFTDLYRGICAGSEFRAGCVPLPECALPPSSQGAVTERLRATDAQALDRLVAAQWLPAADCGTSFVSCGATNGTLRVVGLDLDAAVPHRASDPQALKAGIAVLRGLTGLTFLRLPAGLHGDLEVLRALTKLTHLALTGPGITGSTDALLHFPRLRFVSLRQTSVTGPIAALARLTALEVLHLQGPGGRAPSVHGPLSALRGLRALQCLNLRSVNVSGALEDVAEWTALREVRLSRTPLIEGSVGALTHLTTLVIEDVPKMRVALPALAGVAGLTVLWLDGVLVLGSLESLQGLPLQVLAVRNPVAPSHVDAPLNAVQRAHFLWVLDLANANVHGDVGALSRLPVRVLSLQAASNGRISGSLKDLARLPLQHLELQDCGVGGPLGALGHMRHLTHLQLVNVSVYTSLYPAAGLPYLSTLFLSGLDFRGDLRPLANFTQRTEMAVALRGMKIRSALPVLPPTIVALDLQGNCFFSSTPVVVDAPALRYLSLKDNHIGCGSSTTSTAQQRGRVVGLLNLAPGSLVNLHGNALECPLPRLPTTALLADPCDENLKLLFVFLNGAVVVVLIVGFVFGNGADLKVPEPDEGRRVWLKFIAIILVVRMLTIGDVVTDLINGGQMFRAIAVEPSCAHMAMYEALTEGEQGARPNATGGVAPLNRGRGPTQRGGRSYSISMDELKTICEDKYNCRLEQESCNVVDPDPNAWFRNLLVTSMAILAVKEVAKIAMTVYYVCRSRVPPAEHRHFCGTGCLSIPLTLAYRPLWAMFTHRPTPQDLLWQMVYDGLCEDVVQFVLQLLFVKCVSQTGLSVVQYLSLFTTVLGLCTVAIRAIAMYFQRRASTTTVSPTESLPSSPSALLASTRRMDVGPVQPNTSTTPPTLIPSSKSAFGVDRRSGPQHCGPGHMGAEKKYTPGAPLEYLSESTEGQGTGSEPASPCLSQPCLLRDYSDGECLAANGVAAHNQSSSFDEELRGPGCGWAGRGR